MKIFPIVALALILCNNFPLCHSAPTKIQPNSFAENYTAFTDDVKWFFRGVSQIAGTVEHMLPNVNASVAENGTFSENTRVTLLLGIRHLLAGVREIAMTFEQSFNTDHIKQLQQVKNATEFVNEFIIAMRRWFNQLRAFVVHLVQVYNRYIPEMLFGKCLGSYLSTTYPEHSYYEYPFILLSEMYASVVTPLTPQTEATEMSTELAILDTELQVEQNEISQSYLDDFKKPYSGKTPRNLAAPSTRSTESFFDFSSVLNENKNSVIENAINQQSWQMCFKLYTAESISRSLKLYFLGL